MSNSKPVWTDSIKPDMPCIGCEVLIESDEDDEEYETSAMVLTICEFLHRLAGRSRQPCLLLGGMVEDTEEVAGILDDCRECSE